MQLWRLATTSALFGTSFSESLLTARSVDDAICKLSAAFPSASAKKVFNLSFSSNFTDRQVGVVVQDIGAEGFAFNSGAGQIRHYRQRLAHAATFRCCQELAKN